MLFASRPKTPLRVFCIATFEYLARLRGGTSGKRRRMAVAYACDFGSLCDDYYDHGRLDADEYRSLRRELRRLVPEAATARYIRRLREAERNRPAISKYQRANFRSVIAYRTSVLELSLRWMQEISGTKVKAEEFGVLVNLVGLMQIVDDVLDWKEDWARGCPTYVTAVLLDRAGRGVAAPVRAEADALVRQIVRSARRDAGAIPFVLAGIFTWLLVVLLIKVRFRR